MKMTRFENSHGETIAADQEGNNVAFICQACGHPVLAHPDPKSGFKNTENATCEGCGQAYNLEWRKAIKTMVITYEP